MLELSAAKFETLPGAPQAFVVPISGPALVGMPYPHHGVQWNQVADAGIGLVVDCSGNSLRYDCHPIDRLAVPLQDLVGGGPPDDEEHEKSQIRTAVAHISSAREKQTGVIVHCVGGRGRTGTVLGAYLVRTGYRTSTVIRWLNDVHQLRGRSGWPESPWQRDLLKEFG